MHLKTEYGLITALKSKQKQDGNDALVNTS